MPEGDTIFKIARTLSAVLVGRRVVRVRSPIARIAAAPLAGRTVASVEPRGKHLLIHIDDRTAIWTHLRMSGSWHVYRTGEKWQRPRFQLRVALDVDGFCAACFNAPVCELLSEGQLKTHPVLLGLGPDASAAAFDDGEAVRRLRSLPDLALGEAVLRQHAWAGLGNVFKSELLFLLGQDPFTKVADVPVARIAELVALGRKLMLENRFAPTRVTRRSLEGQGTRWVYGRAGQPCRRCGTPIRMRRQGQLGRSTYYCPRCQHVSVQPRPHEARREAEGRDASLSRGSPVEPSIRAGGHGPAPRRRT